MGYYPTDRQSYLVIEKAPGQMARGSVPRCMVSEGGCGDCCPAFFIYWLIDVAVGMGTQL